MTLAVSAYLNTLQNNFVWDDTQQILRNPDIRGETPVSHLFTSDVWSFSHPGRPSRNNYYRPLQMLMYRLTAKLFGFSPSAFHTVNLILHLMVTLLAYASFYQLTRSLALAFTGGVLFALDPIHTEAVAWISASTEIGCALFFLLAFFLFLLAMRASTEPGDRRFVRVTLWLSSYTSFALAMLWKEMAVTLPFVIASYLLFFDLRTSSPKARLRRALGRTLPYWIVVAAYLPLRHHALGFLYTSQRKFVLSPAGYFLTVLHLISKYFLELVLPLHLNAYQVFDPVQTLSDPRALAAIVFLLLVVAAFAYGWKRSPLAVFAGSWIFLTLIPVLNLRAVGRNVFAERYLYIPSLGFCLLAVWLASEALAMLPAGYRSWVGVCSLILVASLYLAGTVNRNQDWKDDFTLFSRTLEQSPNSPDLQNRVADLLRSEKGDSEGAEQHYLRGVALAEEQNPPEWDQLDSAYIGLALIDADRRQFERALAALDKAQAADPTDPQVESVRGSLLLELGRWKEAQTILSKRLAANSKDENVLNALGTIAWQDEHHYEQALDYFERALEVHPAADAFNASLHNNLGSVYCEMGRCPEAVEHFRRAIELVPDDPEYRTNLGSAFGLTGRPAEARAELEKVLTLAPNYAPAREALSNLESNAAR